MVLRVVMHHIESTGTEINEAASGRRLRYRYFSETLQRLVNLNAFVGQAEATGLIRKLIERIVLTPVEDEKGRKTLSTQPPIPTFANGEVPNQISMLNASLSYERQVAI